MSRTCLDCPRQVSKGSVYGRCKACANAHKNRSPEQREHARKAMTAGRASGRITTPPETRSAAMKRHIAENPATLLRLAEMGRKGAAAITPEVLARRGRTQSATLQRKRAERLAWCPQERLGEFERLKNAVGVAEAKRIILEDIAAAERRRLAAMTPLERQLEAIRKGARVVRKADFRTTLPAYTLGGIATAQL